MKTNYLFPHKYKRWGWALLIPGLILGIWYLIKQPEPDFFQSRVIAIAFESNSLFGEDSNGFFTIVKNNLFNELAAILIIIGAILVAFSKEKEEDELIQKLRLSSLHWAVYVNYAILLISIVFFYDFTFFWVMVLNMFTVLLFFIVRFQWAKQKLDHEELH